MIEVGFTQVTLSGDSGYILLSAREIFNPDVTTPEHLFHFEAFNGVDSAFAICATLYEYEGDAQANLKVMTGEFEDCFAFLLKEKDSSRCCSFTFLSEQDLNTACEMVAKFFELAHADEDADEGEGEVTTVG